MELHRDLEAYFQHLTSLIKTSDFNDNWTQGKNTFKHLYFIDDYTMFENLIKINFVDTYKMSFSDIFE